MVSGFGKLLRQFLFHPSDQTEVLQNLTENARWCLFTSREEALIKIKRIISTAAYYDVPKPDTIHCDTSQAGLGAALMQDGTQLLTCSRALTSTERKPRVFSHRVLLQKNLSGKYVEGTM